MEQENQVQIEKPKSIPKDIVSLYIEGRQGMSNAIDDFEYYMKLRESIKIGSSLLPKDSPLKKEARTILKSEQSYLPKRNMDFYKEKGIYSLSTGSGIIGTVSVRPDEVERGERWIINQQASIVIRFLEDIDEEIFDYLVDSGRIPVESPESIIRRKLQEAWEVENAIHKE